LAVCLGFHTHRPTFGIAPKRIYCGLLQLENAAVKAEAVVLENRRITVFNVFNFSKTRTRINNAEVVAVVAAVHSFGEVNFGLHCFAHIDPLVTLTNKTY